MSGWNISPLDTNQPRENLPKLPVFEGLHAQKTSSQHVGNHESRITSLLQKRQENQKEMKATHYQICKFDIYKLSCVMLYKEMCQHFKDLYNSVHFCSLTQSCLTLCDPMDCSTPGLPVPHHLLEFAQIHIHCIGDAIQPSHPLRPSSPSALNLSQHQRLF